MRLWRGFKANQAKSPCPHRTHKHRCRHRTNSNLRPWENPLKRPGKKSCNGPHRVMTTLRKFLSSTSKKAILKPIIKLIKISTDTLRRTLSGGIISRPNIPKDRKSKNRPNKVDLLNSKSSMKKFKS